MILTAKKSEKVDEVDTEATNILLLVAGGLLVVVLILLLALGIGKLPKGKPKCHIKLKPAPENCQCALEDFEPAVWN